MRYFIFACLLVIITGCYQGSVKNTDLSKSFAEQGLQGCFAMFDNGQGTISVHNNKMYTDSQLIPYSTYKIMISLMGIEKGVVNDDSTLIPWGGLKSDDTAKNKDLTLDRAFKLSTNDHFMTILKKLGRPAVQSFMDSVFYGNQITNDSLTFWHNGQLRISPDAQLALVKRLYFKQLKPFQERTHRIVTRMMEQEKNNLYKLAYKTGTGKDAQGNWEGWMVGWIEENIHPYFFVLHVKGNNNFEEFMTKREALLRKILTDKGFFKGKK
jgi:beta-lactamase class D